MADFNYVADFQRDTDGKLAKWAWPGSYPIFYVTSDGAALCADCARGENGSDATTDALDADGDESDPQWLIVGADIQWEYEGSPLVCDHCGDDIESAYGDVSAS